MRVVFAWMRVELRRRWRSLVVLALLIAISTGTVLATVAGARRGDSSVDRLLAETLPADAVVQPQQPGFDWTAVRALPQVEALGLITFGSYTINGVGDPAYVLYKLPADVDVMRTVERPVVLAGRLANVARADEAVITARYAQQSGLGVGDTVQLGLYRPETVDPAGGRSVVPVRPALLGAVTGWWVCWRRSRWRRASPTPRSTRSASVRTPPEWRISATPGRSPCRVI